MKDIKNLLEAHARGDYDAVLKGTSYHYQTHIDARGWDDTYTHDDKYYEGCRLAHDEVSSDQLENAATAHVLTLLVGEVEKAFNAVMNAKSLADAKDQIIDAIALAAMMNHPTQQAEEK